MWGITLDGVVCSSSHVQPNVVVVLCWQVQLWDCGNGNLSMPSQYHTILLGELNFNLDGSLSAPLQAYSNRSDWKQLWDCDQLIKQQRAGRLLQVVETFFLLSDILEARSTLRGSVKAY